MLKIAEIRVYKDKAIERFKEVFAGFDPPKIVVVPTSKRQAVRCKVLRECGLDYKEDLYGTDAEVIDGPLGKQIVLYQSVMKSERQVCHALWHELGHIVFGNEKQYGINLAEDTPMRSGYAVFNEFIAEYIAYLVSDREGFGIYNPNMYLQLAFQEEGTINPYWLSRYMAIIAGDSNVSDECVAEGAEYVKPVVWNYLTEMFRMIDKQLKKDDFWKATPTFIEELGSIYDDMFSVVFKGLY